MKVVTHNIKHTLGFKTTKTSVDRALRSRPAIVGLQEFDPKDEAALTNYGQFVDLSKPETLRLPKGRHYLICVDKAHGLPVLLKGRYVHSIHSIHSGRIVRSMTNVRPTLGTFVRFTNRFGTKISLLNTHPMAHHDIPKNKQAWEEARVFINEWASNQPSQGYTPIITMDGNGLKQVTDMISCWDGHELLPTGPGGTTIDMVFTEKHSDHVDTFGTPSDHNGVVATYNNFH